MELTQWQQRFERWLDENRTSDDAAHDISHFRRVWKTAAKNHVSPDRRSAGGPDRLLFSRYC